MHSTQQLAIFVLCVVAMAAAVPVPEPGWKSKHEHYVIHVPYHVKHIHHHHVKKVPVYVKESGWAPSAGWSSGWAPSTDAWAGGWAW